MSEPKPPTLSDAEALITQSIAWATRALNLQNQLTEDQQNSGRSLGATGRLRMIGDREAALHIADTLANVASSAVQVIQAAKLGVL